MGEEFWQALSALQAEEEYSDSFEVEEDVPGLGGGCGCGPSSGTVPGSFFG